MLPRPAPRLRWTPTSNVPHSSAEGRFVCSGQMPVGLWAEMCDAGPPARMDGHAGRAYAGADGQISRAQGLHDLYLAVRATTAQCTSRLVRPPMSECRHSLHWATPGRRSSLLGPCIAGGRGQRKRRIVRHFVAERRATLSSTCQCRRCYGCRVDLDQAPSALAFFQRRSFLHIWRMFNRWHSHVLEIRFRFNFIRRRVSRGMEYA
jgi:hypothetical protein